MNEDYLKIGKVGTPIETASPIASYTANASQVIMDPENNPSTPGRTAKGEGSGSFKMPVFDTQQKYINNGTTVSHEAAKNFSFAKDLAGGEGTNGMSFLALTSSIQRGEGMGNLNQMKSIYHADGTVDEVAKNLHLIG